MRKTLYLHIGAHKTGTTSIQSYLHQNRDRLLAEGLLYPQAFGHRLGHHQLYFRLEGGDKGSAPADMDLEREFVRLYDEIDGSPAENVIMSSEGLFSLSKQGIEQLADRLAGYDITAIAAIRRPDRLFESAYNQKIKSAEARFSTSHARFVNNPFHLVRDLRFDRALRNWAQVLGRRNLKVVCYEDYQDSLDLITGLLNLRRENFKEPEQRSNESLSVRGAELIRRGKLKGLDEASLGMLSLVALSRFPREEEEGALLSPAERLAVLDACDPVTDLVFDRFLHRANDYASRNFSLADFPPQVTLDPEEAEAILAEF